MFCEGSRLQNGGLTILLISLPADSTTKSTTNIALFPVISSEHRESRNLSRHARPDRASAPCREAASSHFVIQALHRFARQ